TSAGSTRRAVPCSSGSRCRAAPASAGWNGTARISSIVAAAEAERSAPCGVRKQPNRDQTKEHTMNTAISEVSTVNHPVVSGDRWVAERKTLLAHEKELTRLRDQIARERRALPWVRIGKNYVFDALEGRRTLADLFEGRRQLLVQHFMFGPGWEQGCPS